MRNKETSSPQSERQASPLNARAVIIVGGAPYPSAKNIWQICSMRRLLESIARPPEPHSGNLPRRLLYRKPRKRLQPDPPTIYANFAVNKDFIDRPSITPFLPKSPTFATPISPKTTPKSRTDPAFRGFSEIFLVPFFVLRRQI